MLKLPFETSGVMLVVIIIRLLSVAVSFHRCLMCAVLLIRLTCGVRPRTGRQNKYSLPHLSTMVDFLEERKFSATLEGDVFGRFFQQRLTPEVQLTQR